MALVGGAWTLAILAFMTLGCSSLEPQRHLPPHQHAPPCLQTEFFCKSHDQCVKSEHVCDGTPDCNDRSDEDKCGEHESTRLHCNDPYFFHCDANQTCINPGWKCDGKVDCMDESDEKDCGPATRSTISFSDISEFSSESNVNSKSSSQNKCDSEEFQCNDGLCISSSMVCDDISDCFDGSDEERSMCLQRPCDPRIYFQCKVSKICIPHRWRCDGSIDCEVDGSDGSDELGCDDVSKSGAGSEIECPDGTFNCEDGSACIAAVKVCDGTKDCPNGNDESATCASSCDLVKCESECVRNPVGNGTCTCPPGYKLIDDKLQCQDIDECAEYGVCDQVCRNKVGTFECSCVEGYHTSGSGKECRAKANFDAMLFFAGKTEIRGLNLKSGRQFTVTNDRLWANTAIGIGYDAQDERVFWTALDSTKSRIVSSKRDGSDPRVVVTDLVMPESLAIDHVARNIYYSEPAESYLGVCSIDGKWCAKLLSRDVRQPREISLHSPSGLLFYSDWGVSPKIASVGMDGTMAKTVISSNLHWPNGISVDSAVKRIYWSDAKHDILESSYFDGSDRRRTDVNVIKHPFSLAVFENRLYWSDWDLKEIQSCDKLTGNNREILFNDTKIEPFGIHIYHPVLEQSQNNPCFKSTCSHLCLLAAGAKTFTCKCPEDMTLGPDERTCKSNQKLITTPSVTISSTVGLSPSTTTMAVNLTEVGQDDDIREDLADDEKAEDDGGSSSAVGESAVPSSLDKRRMRIGLAVGVVILMIVAGFIIICLLTHRGKGSQPSPVLKYKNPAFGYQESFESDLDIFVEDCSENPEKKKKAASSTTDLTQALDGAGRPGSRNNSTTETAAEQGGGGGRLGFNVWRPRNNRYYKL